MLWLDLYDVEGRMYNMRASNDNRFDVGELINMDILTKICFRVANRIVKQSRASLQYKGEQHNNAIRHMLSSINQYRLVNQMWRDVPVFNTHLCRVSWSSYGEKTSEPLQTTQLNSFSSLGHLVHLGQLAQLSHILNSNTPSSSIPNSHTRTRCRVQMLHRLERDRRS